MFAAPKLGAMASLAGEVGEGGPGAITLTPEGRHDGPDQRIVLYSLEVVAGGESRFSYRAGASMREIARLARALRRLARDGEPFAGLTLGWAISVRGDVEDGRLHLTLLHEAAGAAVDAYPVVVEAAAIEAFVTDLEAQVTALP